MIGQLSFFLNSGPVYWDLTLPMFVPSATNIDYDTPVERFSVSRMQDFFLINPLKSFLAVEVHQIRGSPQSRSDIRYLEGETNIIPQSKPSCRLSTCNAFQGCKKCFPLLLFSDKS